MRRVELDGVLGAAAPIIGMVHLLPLPGAPRHGGMQQVLDRACSDAATLSAGGVAAIMIENFGDAPFFPDAVPAEVVAGITAAVAAVRSVTSLPLGVNVLRNDARAALGVAAATGATFIRVNVHTGAMLTDQGWIAGRAHETMRARGALAAAVAVMADVLVKHAVPPAGLTIGDAARDTWERGLADALIVSGAHTGAATAPDRLRAVRTAVPAAPLVIGSGLAAANAAELMPLADAAIVGSAFQHGGHAGGRIEADRVARLIEAVVRARG